MQEIRLTVRLEVKPEFKRDVVKQAQQLVKTAKKEKGCLQYDFHKSHYNPNVYVFIERWDSEAAFNVHTQSDKYCEFSQLIDGKLIAQEYTLLELVD